MYCPVRDRLKGKAEQIVSTFFIMLTVTVDALVRRLRVARNERK